MTINRLPGLFVLFTFMLIVASFVLRPAGLWFNDELLMISFYFAVAYWLLTLIMVASNIRLNRQQKRFWLLLLIALPFLGGIIYQLVQPGFRKNTYKPKHVAANNTGILAEPRHQFTVAE